MGWDGERWASGASLGPSAPGRPAAARSGVGTSPDVGDLLRDEAAQKVVAAGCAFVLLLAPVAPRELARTTWEERTWDGGARINDDPSGYVGLVSAGWPVALADLLASAVGARIRPAATAGALARLAAGAANAAGAYAAVAYWLGFPRGDRLLEGREMLGSRAEPHFPLLLPVFAGAASPAHPAKLPTKRRGSTRFLPS